MIKLSSTGQRMVVPSPLVPSKRTGGDPWPSHGIDGGDSIYRGGASGRGYFFIRWQLADGDTYAYLYDTWEVGQVSSPFMDRAIQQGWSPYGFSAHGWTYNFLIRPASQDKLRLADLDAWLASH